MSILTGLSLKSMRCTCVIFDFFNYLTAKFLILGKIENQYKDFAYTKISGILDILDIMSEGHIRT